MFIYHMHSELELNIYVITTGPWNMLEHKIFVSFHVGNMLDREQIARCKDLSHFGNSCEATTRRLTARLAGCCGLAVLSTYSQESEEEQNTGQ